MKRRKTDTVQLSKIRMREALRLKLVRDALRAAKTLNNEIVERLEKSYEQDERKSVLQHLEEIRQELKRIEEQAKRYETATIVDALLGDDAATKRAVRSVALLLANNPGWSATPDSIQKIAEGVSAAIKVAAGVRTQ
jgi:molecular chaperone GrpE (heat shock protein)